MLRYVKNGMLLLSIAFIVLGVLLLVMPPTSKKGAVKPLPRTRTYWIRQTTPVSSTTAPKA
ncbi:hypothetical protein H6B10_17085 [Gemmiger formicilis]|nr:hypothetical protein [Gemmiger formicilis]